MRSGEPCDAPHLSLQQVNGEDDILAAVLPPASETKLSAACGQVEQYLVERER